MDATFWLDNVLSGCAALSVVVLLYGGLLCLSDLLEPLRQWMLRRLRDEAAQQLTKEREG